MRTGTVGGTAMSDDLRTRIATTMLRIFDEDQTLTVDMGAWIVADAVIRELGLRTEWLTHAGSRLGIPHLTKPDNPIATRTASPWTAHTHQDTP